MLKKKTPHNTLYITAQISACVTNLCYNGLKACSVTAATIIKQIYFKEFCNYLIVVIQSQCIDMKKQFLYASLASQNALAMVTVYYLLIHAEIQCFKLCFHLYLP